MSVVSSRVPSSIWRSMHDANLSAAARVLYLYLITSPSQTEIGAVEVGLTRWATLTAVDPADLDSALDELAAAGFLTVDREIGELVVAGYFDWNTSPYVGVSRRNAAMGIVSSKVRNAALGK